MAKKSENYEMLLNKLKDIVNSMENNEQPLEESMKSYEEGVKLCNKLYTILNNMEGKINVLNNENEEVFGEEL
ncbi:exodeoxyribonuclease VII small subunit [Clostridium hydrogeniformans]|uniref:exodeoxyribonuclease VII small subunit n=1 Tax=Clostridium hydrogeniformans TaxID=349933 RepID=UPI0004887BFD|nr:exodeoxyribonuclease VII small subunit [Clostridium hydrogeniformans]